MKGGTKQQFFRAFDTSLQLENHFMKRPHTLLTNWISLTALFTIILGFHVWFEPRFLKSQTISENEPLNEQQIVLEDLQNQVPLEESETVHMPEPAKAVPEKPIAGEAGLKKIALPKPPTPAPPKKMAVVHYAKPDPYTNGGPMDLDRRYTDEPIDQENATTLYRTSDTPPDARDYFIPFEDSTKN